MASELVTNAVQATGITHPSPRWSELRNLALIRLRLVVMGNGLIIEVWDRDATPPKPRQETALDAEGGRGGSLSNR